ncbi:hypothetical protein AB1K56_11335 [Microbacterium sp. BWR-S6Y]|uniref:hypothetical protein n=1 Tax=Microbacterium sp. BWR-S6Y TaxID=3232073 RepID=UPI0035274EE5
MTTIDPVPSTPPEDAKEAPVTRRPPLTRRLVAGIGAGALVVGLLVGGGAGFAIGNASAAAAATSGTMPDFGGGTPPQMGGDRPDFGGGTPPQMGEDGPGGSGSTDGSTGGGTDGSTGGTTDDSGTTS